MKLIAYQTSRSACHQLVPASRTRKWMDETPGAFAYHCLPLVMANSLGWFLLNGTPCEMEWDGSEAVEGLKIWPDHKLDETQKHSIPISHFGSGIVTFHSGYLFQTEEKISILAKGPANNPKHGIVALEGVVETDWLPFPFTINWKMTVKNVRVRFEQGEPIAQIIPYPSELISTIEPETRQLADNPELLAKYQNFREKRTIFNKTYEDDPTDRQKYYMRGEDSLGNKYPENHRTDWKTKPFVSKS